MGWSLGYDSRHGRDIGYGVPAYCDHPDCNEEIDRGLGYVCCGQQPYGGDDGCGLYFCGKHSDVDGKCEYCAAWDEDDRSTWRTFDPKPDHPTWIHHKLTDESWARWRAENPAKVQQMRAVRRAPSTGETP